MPFERGSCNRSLPGMFLLPDFFKYWPEHVTIGQLVGKFDRTENIFFVV